VLSQIKLAVDEGPDQPVTVVQRLGLPDQQVFQVAWDDLDRSFEPDHLTSIYVPAMAEPVGAELVRFAELMRTLRERCPWDAAQTHSSLTRHLLEETYEVLDAIDGFERTGDPAHLEEELGDLLFQVYFHAAVAAEEGHFTLADVARGIHDKLVARHPHVFAGAEIPDPADAHSAWEAMKRAEKKRTSIFDGIPPDLPALALAHKVLSKAAASGDDFPLPTAQQAWAALDDGADAEAFGQVLLATVAAARAAGVDAEAALRSATRRLRDSSQA
jgi:MazG family protein